MMQNLVPIELLVDQPVAKELQEKGLAEVVLRHADAKYRSFVKCALSGVSEQAKDRTEQLLQSQGERLNIQGLRSFLSNASRKSAEWDNAFKSLSLKADSLVGAANFLRGISFINVGLELANIGVDIRGFKMIAAKVDNLHSEIESIAERVDQVIQIKADEKIANSQNLFMRINAMGDKLDNNREIDLDRLEELLIDLKSFLSEMISATRNKTLNLEITLQIVHTLMPGYTLLLGEFLKLYYFVYQNSPNNYDMFMSIYDELDDKAIRNIIFDYYMLEQKKPNIDVIDILNTQFLLGAAGKIQVETEMDLVRPLKTREKYEAFEKEVDDAVQEQIVQVLASA